MSHFTINAVTLHELGGTTTVREPRTRYNDRAEALALLHHGGGGMMKIGDSVAMNADPHFRDRHYHARQYGRVLSIYNGKVMVDWSDMGLPDGPWTPRRPEQYAIGCLRVVYTAPEVTA